MAKWRLNQLLEELLANLSEKDGDLIFVVLLLEISIVKEYELGSLSQSWQVAVEIPRLFPQSTTLLADFFAEYSAETQDGWFEWHAANSLVD